MHVKIVPSQPYHSYIVLVPVSILFILNEKLNLPFGDTVKK